MKVLIIIIAIIMALFVAADLLNLLPRAMAPSSLIAYPAPESTQAPASAPGSKSAPATAPLTSQSSKVAFYFAVTNISGSGLSRTVSAKVTNRGSTDAHNVWAKVEAFSAGSRVSLNGQDNLRVDIGNLIAGESIVKEVTLSLTLTDGMKVMKKGAHLELTMLSDERTETFSYDYTP